MELDQIPLWDRIGQTVVLFAVLLVSDYIEGGYNWPIILGVPIVVFMAMIAYDVVRGHPDQ